MPTGLILQPTYRIRGGRPVVQLFGRLEGAQAFLVEDDRFRPYFFVPKADLGALARDPRISLEETALRDFDGREVVRVVAPVPGAIPSLRERLERGGGCTLEADIRFPYRYLIDRGLRGGVAIDGPAETREGSLLCFRNPELRPARCRPRLRVLSVDLETSPDASEIFSVALVTSDTEEVHLVSQDPVPGAHVYANETRMLAGAASRLRAMDPDIVTGWNAVDFDLKTWEGRCRELRLSCELGRVEGPIAFHQDPHFSRQTRAEIPGRVVLDGLPLVRDAVRLEDYRLETAARAILGRGKLIDADAPDAAAEIERLYRQDPQALVAYNREDARLVLDILEREGLIELTLERGLLCGMQLDRVGASIASFDLVYLPELRRRGVVAPSVDTRRKSELVRGGALLDPRPGLFWNVAVYDFKSLYPSLIRTFNLDPLAHARAGPDAIEAPNGARFSPRDAILPEVIERFMKRREEAKRRGDRHADQAIKIMMNAFFGVLGAASCRFFDPEIANAITGFGQQILGWTREAFEEEGVQALYGDTDSVFVQLETRSGGEAARSEAECLRKRIEARIGERIRCEYGVKPKLELELERIFDGFFLPRVRGGASGSKKRYAGWIDGRLELVGLESVRRDWPAVAGRLQRGLLTRLFTQQEVIPFARELVARVLAGELDRELVYVKRIRKGSLERYTAATPPHVQAARKVQGKVGPVVRYVITRSGPEPVFPGRPLPEGIDRRHYVERVLRPVSDAILPQLGRSFDEVLDRPRQLPLL